MPSVTESASALSSLALGDIAFLPGVPPASVRLLVTRGLGEPVSAFAVLGEMDCVAAECGSPSGALDVFSPVEVFPPNLASAKIVAEGAAAFWSAHLRSAQGGMGEAYFRIMLPPGQVDVVFLLYRGPEVVVFVRSGTVDAGSWRVQEMPRSADTDVSVVSRFAAVVEPLGVPLPPLVPAPAHPEPERVPARVR
jgi:hypothetical protein